VTLAGRVVVVTGGGRGLGREHCLELARQGAGVVVNDLDVDVHGKTSNESPADLVVKEIEEAGGTAIADGTSVTDWDGIRSLVAGTVEHFGRLDAVVNNAGFVRDRMVTSMSKDEFDTVVEVHLKGTFTVLKHACDHWRSEAKAGRPVTGRVVNTTSGAGLFGNVGQANYGAAKAGIANLTIITAMEMGRYGVTANAISPIALTRMTETMATMQGYELVDGYDPLDPSNPSPVVAWLCSEASGWLSGAVLRVEGNQVQRVQPWHVDTSTRYTAKSGGKLEAEELDLGMRQAFRVAPSGGSSASLVS
jgi:NAD(P)-dependent dehydrogenase (short-subunit alcohol dehydrogenase family)